MTTNVIWTSKNDEILIEFVRKHEALYNVKSREYRNSELKQRLWSNVGAILEKTGADCCKRWAYVRDYYIRRRGKPGTGSGGEATKKRSDLLTFLDNIPSSQKQNSITKDEISENESEITEDSQADFDENLETKNMTRIDCNEDNNGDDIDKEEERRDDFISYKRKKSTYSEDCFQLLNQIPQQKPAAAQIELDETDLFFSSMAKIVKKLPRHEQIQIRMQISSLVGNAELRSLPDESRQTIGVLSFNIQESDAVLKTEV